MMCDVWCDGNESNRKAMNASIELTSIDRLEDDCELYPINTNSNGLLEPATERGGMFKVSASVLFLILVLVLYLVSTHEYENDADNLEPSLIEEKQQKSYNKLHNTNNTKWLQPRI